MPARLLLVTHGQTTANAGQDVVQGFMQNPLDEQGRREARRLGRRLKLENVQRLLSSDRRRALETAAIIGREIGLRPVRSAAWRPLDTGFLSGKPSEEARPVIRRFAQEPGKRIPEGESLNSFKARLFPALSRLLAAIRNEGLTVALVTHSRDLSLIEDWLAAHGHTDRMKLRSFLADRMRPAAIMEITPSGDFWKSKMIDSGGG